MAEQKKKTSSVNYEAVSDRIIVDKRFAREQAFKDREKEQGFSRGANSGVAASGTSSAFDAFQRMATGMQSKTLADKIANPNRPTWEQYKKDNEDKLHLGGAESLKMAEYRAQLDREREMKLSRGTNHAKPSNAISDSGSDSSSESDSESDDSGRHRKKRKISSKDKKHSKKDKQHSKKDKKKSSKHGKHRKEKKHGSSNRSDSDEDRHNRKKRKKDRKENSGGGGGSDPSEGMRLSNFMQGSDSD